MTNRNLTDFEFNVFNFKCFDSTGSGAFSLSPVNVIIGRNNAGKSAIVDFLSILVARAGTHKRLFDPAKHGRPSAACSFTISHCLSAEDLNARIDAINNSMRYGVNQDILVQWLDGRRITVRYRADQTRMEVDLIKGSGTISDLAHGFEDVLSGISADYMNRAGIIRIAAERSILQEPMSSNPTIMPDGTGITDAIAGQINHVFLDRRIVEVDILNDLNNIYMGDSAFSELTTQIDQAGWEVFLTEKDKGDIRISESGSGLKTILHIVSVFRLMRDIDWSQQIVSIDEPENNLHPALFRRLLEYLSAMQKQRQFILLITTHSNVAIDWATQRDNAQVLHVTHNGVRSKLNKAARYGQTSEILNDLEFRASDLFQANGIVWVEGPSDRIYLNRWIRLFTDDTIKEGLHYRILSYGGRLLSHLDGSPPNVDSETISMLSINRNCAILIDSDRKIDGALVSEGVTPRVNINSTKRRIKKEVSSNGGFVWITEGREIENYISGRVISEFVGKSVSEVEPYEAVLMRKELSKYQSDKVSLASKIAPLFDLRDIEERMDLPRQLSSLVKHIKRWNGLSE